MVQMENHVDGIRKGERHGDIEFDPALIRELSENLYPTHFDCLREYAANAWDADSEKLRIYKLEKDTGPKLVIEDWGVGIEDLDRFWRVGMPIKEGIKRTPVLGRPVIGSKGIGKLSYRKLGKGVEMLTRTNQSGFYSTVDFDVDRYSVKEFDDPEEALPHVGTMAIISGLDRDMDLIDIVSYCNSNLYGLILPGIASDRPMSIYVNRTPISPTMPEGKGVKIRTKFGPIRGVLSASDASRLDVLLRGVKIKNINPETTRPVSGYVNVDWLKPTTDRHDFVRDSDEYTAFYESLRKYIRRTFPTHYEGISRKKRTQMRSLARMMDVVIEKVGIFPEPIETTVPERLKKTPAQQRPVRQPAEPPATPQPSQTDVGNTGNYDFTLRPDGSPKRGMRPIRSKYGIDWVLGQYGEDSPSVIVNGDSNTVVFNMDKVYVSGIDDMSPRERVLMMVHLFARGYALLVGEFADIGKYQDFVDDVSFRLLSMVG